MVRRLAQQSRDIAPALIWVGALLSIAIVLLVGAHFGGVAVEVLTRDPLAIAGLPPHTGLLSQVGVFFWAGSLTLTVHAIARHPAADQRVRRFLLVVAALTLALMVDDAFMVHEAVLPRYGIEEAATYVLYAVLLGAMLVGHWRLFWRTDFLLLFAALGAFACSVVVDLVIEPSSLAFLLEDGAKFAGILLWTSYSWRLTAGLDQLSKASASEVVVAPGKSQRGPPRPRSEGAPTLEPERKAG